MMQNKVMPKLRFREFSGAWEEYKFKDLYEFKSTNSLSRDKLNYEVPNVKNIHYGDIHVRFKSLFDIMHEKVPYINLDVNIAKINQDNYLKEGDVIIADASENYEDIGKSIEIIHLNNEKVLSGLHTFLARKKTTLNYNGFMTFIFKSESYRKQIHKIAQGTKVLSLSSGRVAETIFQIPSLAEQEKIANYLSALDEKINLLSAKAKELLRYKKAMMQKLFAQEIRFKPVLSEAEVDDEGKEFAEWEEKTLGDVILFLSDYTANGSFASLKDNVQYYNEENYAVLVRTTDLEKKTFKPERFTDERGYNFLKKTSLYGGEIILANVGSIGKVYKVPNYDKPMTLAPNTYVIKFNSDVIEDFVYQWMLTDKFKQILLSKVGSSTLKAINKNNLRSIVFSYPSLGEQQKIADFLSAIDEKINTVQEQINHMQSFKKAMLQQMFV